LIILSKIVFSAGFPGWGPSVSGFGGMNVGFGGSGGRGRNLLIIKQIIVFTCDGKEKVQNYPCTIASYKSHK